MLNAGSHPWTSALLLALALALGGCNSSGSTGQDPGEDTPPDLASMPVVPIYIDLDPQALDVLYARDPQSNDRLDAFARAGGLDVGETPIEIRFRGSSSRFLPKKSFNIRFAEGRDFLFGSPRMNANAMYTDPSMMRESLAWGMFADLGRPASRARYADLWLNGIYEGLYVHIERVDANLLRNAGLDPDGTLVRDQFRDQRRVDPRIDVFSAFGFALSGIDEAERASFLSDGFDSRGSPDWDRLVDLVLWVEQSDPGAEFEVGFRERFDDAVFTDWLAVHFLIADVDSFGDDYWLYLDHGDEEARWLVIPWDKDLSFGSHFREDFGTANDFFTYEKPVEGGWGNRLIDLYLQTPGLRGQLVGRMRELMRGIFDPAYFEARVEETWEAIRESVERQPGAAAFARHPQNHFSAQGVPELHLQALSDFVRLRYAYLDRWKDPKPGPVLEAAVELGSTDLPERVRFTDAQGFTLADLEFLSAPEGTGTLAMQVREDPAQHGIDRVWTLQSDVPAFDAVLRLYYRNDLPAAFSGENWYTGGLDPVGRQGELVVAERFGVMEEIIEGSFANPFSNTAGAPISVQPGLPREFVLTLP